MNTDTKCAFASVFIRVYLWQFSFFRFDAVGMAMFPDRCRDDSCFSFAYFASFVVPLETIKDAKKRARPAGGKPAAHLISYRCKGYFRNYRLHLPARDRRTSMN